MSESGNGATENVPAGPGDQRLTPILAKEILSAKAVLPDLPSKKNGTQYESWRDTVTEDLKTSIYAITKDTQGGKELFKHLCELIQPQHPDTTFPDIDNLGLLLANLHVAVRKCVHKVEDSQPLLDAIKDANVHSEKAIGLSNGILSLRALDGHFLKRAVLQRKDGLKKFQHATLTDLTQSKKWMQTLKTNANIGKVDPFLVVDKIHQEFKKHELTKYAAEEFYQRCSNDEIDDATVQDYVEAMDYAVDSLDTDDAFTNTGPKNESAHMHVVQNQGARGFKINLCQQWTGVPGSCRFGTGCFNKHGKCDIGTEEGKKRYLEKTKGKGKGTDSKDKDMQAMINAAVASAMASATINAAQATASGSGTRASCQLHPSSVPPCLCESLNKWCCPLHCDYDEKDYFACEKVLDKIHFYDGIEKLNSLGRSSVLNVLSSGKVVLTQKQGFSVGERRNVKSSSDGWKLVHADRGVGSICSRVRSEAGQAVTGPAFFPRNFDEHKNDLCDNSVIEGNLMQQAPPRLSRRRR